MHWQCPRNLRNSDCKCYDSELFFSKIHINAITYAIYPFSSHIQDTSSREESYDDFG
jgi:hypothetical protein